MRQQGGFAFLILLAITVSLLLAGNLLIQHYASSSKQITGQIIQQQLRASAESAVDAMRLKLQAGLISTSPPSLILHTPTITDAYLTNCVSRLGLSVANVQTGGNGSTSVTFQPNQLSTSSPSPATHTTTAVVSHLQSGYFIIAACAHLPNQINGQVVALAQTVKLEQGNRGYHLKSLGWQQR